MLNWREETEEEFHSAPLVLVPANLERGNPPSAVYCQFQRGQNSPERFVDRERQAGLRSEVANPARRRHRSFRVLRTGEERSSGPRRGGEWPFGDGELCPQSDDPIG